MKFKAPSGYKIYLTSGIVFLAILAGIGYVEQGVFRYVGLLLLASMFTLHIFSYFYLVTSPLAVFKNTEHKKTFKLKFFALEIIFIGIILLASYLIFDFFSLNRPTGFLLVFVLILFFFLLAQKILQTNKPRL